MWIEAILAKDDLAIAANELFPLRIQLGDGGSLALSEHRDMVLLPGVGLRMTVTLDIHWPVLGIHVPISVRAATLELIPEVLEAPDPGRLTFSIHLVDVDLSAIPVALDRPIVDLVNKELMARHAELSWRFVDTLSHVFELPAVLESAGALDLQALAGRVKVTTEAVALAVLFRARLQPREPAPRPTRTPPAVQSREALIAPPAYRGMPVGGVLVLASMCASALAAALVVVTRPRPKVSTLLARRILSAAHAALRH